jgi:site-specific DNA-adenine methylase
MDFDRYGLPYKGSKSKLAAKIFEIFPTAENFYDLFAGGCAMTHFAIAHKNYKRIIANDINAGPVQLFRDAIEGKFENERRWISRGDFYRLKNSEPYVRYVWSFGNNGENYLYSKEVEPWKKALHFARVFGNFDLFNEFGIRTDGTRKDIRENEEQYKKFYIEWYLKKIEKTKLDREELRKNLEEKIKKTSEDLRQYLVDGLKKSGRTAADIDRHLGTNGMAGHYFSKSQWGFPTKENYQKLQEIIYLPLDYDEVFGVALLLEAVQRLQRLEVCSKSYDEIPILKNSILYCDIPYKDTDGYGMDFDYEKFYAWCEKQTEPVFISSYEMPEKKFCCVKKITHRATLCSGAGLKVCEKVFMPRHQAEKFSVPGELFGWEEVCGF